MKRQTKNREENGHATNGVHVNGVTPTEEEVKPIPESWFLSLIHCTIMPLFLIAATPNLVILLWYTATQCNGSFAILGERLTENGLWQGIVDVWQAVHIGGALTSWVLLFYTIFQVSLMVILPGPQAKGPVTPKGNTPIYKDNGFYCYLVSLAALAVLIYVKPMGYSPSIIYDRFDEFLGSLTVYSIVLCVILCFKGIYFPSSTDCGSSGNTIFDFFWGTELYPRLFGIDVKVFTNCRFGMTVWALLVCIFALKSYELHGFVDSMWVSWALQMLYITKFFWWEAGYMRTIDIMVDRAGYYICWGCLVYVPGIYTSVSLYLVTQPVVLGPALSLIIFTLGLSGIAVNYIADKQKQTVRNTNGECLIWGKKPEVIRAKYQLEGGETRESLLLVSGWWGVSRHFHYIPELFLTFCWSVPALFTNVMAYTYFFWLVILLTHRTFRDDTKCSKKYKGYWNQYCERVPYKIIPYIF